MTDTIEISDGGAISPDDAKYCESCGAATVPMENIGECPWCGESENFGWMA